MGEESEAIQALYRTMRVDIDGLPLCTRSARALGVRVEGEYADVTPDENGDVHPNGQGLSVAVDEARKLARARRPLALGGLSRDPLFSIAPRDVEAPLACFRDAPHHAVIQAGVTMPLPVYEKTLCETRERWRRIDV